MSVLNCETEIGPWNGKLGSETSQDLTVGRPFVLKCSGEWPNFNLAKTELRLEKADHFKLQLLQLQKISSTEGMLKVVSYAAGNHELKALQLVDPESSVVLSDLKFSIKSVIDPKDPPKGPYGPMGPVEIGIPPLFWWSLLLAVILILAGIGLRGYFIWRKRKWLREMKLEGRALSPMAELSKQLRDQLRQVLGLTTEQGQAQRFFESLALAFRIYLARKFLLPTTHMSDGAIVAKVSGSLRSIDPALVFEIRQIFEELKRAQTQIANLRAQDYEQVLKMIRRFGERLEQGELKT